MSIRKNSEFSIKLIATGQSVVRNGDTEMKWKLHDLIKKKTMKIKPSSGLMQAPYPWGEKVNVEISGVKPLF